MLSSTGEVEHRLSAPFRPGAEFVKDPNDVFGEPDPISPSFGNLSQNVSVNESIDSDLSVDGRDAKLSCGCGCSDHGLTKQNTYESMDSRVPSCVDAFAPVDLHSFQVRDEDAPVVHPGKRCLRKGADYRGNIPGPVRTERLKI
jgi:hypothetical protein